MAGNCEIPGFWRDPNTGKYFKIGDGFTPPKPKPKTLAEVDPINYTPINRDLHIRKRPTRNIHHAASNLSIRKMLLIGLTNTTNIGFVPYDVTSAGYDDITEDLLMIDSSASLAFTQTKIWLKNSNNSDHYSSEQLIQHPSGILTKLRSISSIGRQSQNGVLIIGDDYNKIGVFIVSKLSGLVQPLVRMNQSSNEPIYNSCFLDLSTAVVTTSKKLVLLENLDKPFHAKHQQLNHQRSFSQRNHCRYQPVHGNNNLIIHGCKTELRLYDRRMPLKNFFSIKLSEEAVPNSIHLDDQFVTCSLIPWNQNSNNQESVLSLFDLRNLECLDQMGFDRPYYIGDSAKHSFQRSTLIKNTHYPDLQMSVANQMIAFPNQCGTIRLFEAKTLKPIYDFKSSPINREPGSPAFTPKCFLTDNNLFYNRLNNNGLQEIVKCGY